MRHDTTGEIAGMLERLRLVLPNVRANRAATVGRQRPGGENVPRTTDRALVACRWRSG